MNRKAIIITVLILVVIASIAIGYLKSYSNYYELGESDYFKLKVGEEVTIKFDSNGSTGYHHEWINRDQCRHTHLIMEDYSPSLQSRMGYVGSGGTEYWTFKSASIGVDTIIIDHIPPDYFHQYPLNGGEKREIDFRFALVFIMETLED
ncbi:MAG: Chagasin family peptidase inhibitor [Bacteroidota bacterium]|jgi:predicted secreted protein